MTTKITTRTGGIKNRDEYEDKVNECAELEVKLRALTAAQDAELQAVRDKYEAEMQRLTNRKDALLAACGMYASMHRDEVLKPGLRSGETSLASYGFNLGNPTLVLLNRKHTWKTVTSAICDKGPAFKSRYLTIPDPKPNKEALKAGLSDAELAELGCRIEQSDAYYIKAKDNTEA